MNIYLLMALCKRHVNPIAFMLEIHLLCINLHYNDIIMGAIASQITSLTIVYSTVYSDADQRKHQSSASLAFVRGIHQGPVNSLHKLPVTQKMFPFDDVVMINKMIPMVPNWNQFKLTTTWIWNVGSVKYLTCNRKTNIERCDICGLHHQKLFLQEEIIYLI